ncbi:MAG: hypothetical protein JKX83_10430 [Pseudomonadales bacterium]|nr:hypothetical protein [Pseudomonadales bacterium]
MIQHSNDIKLKFHGLGLISLVLYGFLAWCSVDLSRMTLDVFYAVVIALGGIILLLSRDKWHFNSSISLPEIILWAAAFRLMGILGDPIFEDDFYRYLWDGYQFATIGDPFSLAPSAFFTDETIPQTFQKLLDGINYPDIPTIYGPSLQYSFLLAHWLTPGDVLGLQVIYALVDLALIVVLSKLTQNRWWVFLYAWNPLVIKEIAFTAHPDGFGVFFLILACLYAGRQQHGGAVTTLAISICAKPFGCFIAPFILWKMPRVYWLVFVVCIVGLYLPFVLQSNSVVTGLFAFGKEWQFNSFIYGLIINIAPAPFAKLISIGSFLLVYCGYLLYFTRNPNKPIRYDWILAALLFCSPVFNPWYWLWVLPFGVLFASRWLWVTSFAVLLAYMTGINTNNDELSAYELPNWVLILEYGIIVSVIIFDFSSKKFNTKIHHEI